MRLRRHLLTGLLATVAAAGFAWAESGGLRAVYGPVRVGAPAIGATNGQTLLVDGGAIAQTTGLVFDGLDLTGLEWPDDPSYPFSLVGSVTGRTYLVSASAGSNPDDGALYTQQSFMVGLDPGSGDTVFFANPFADQVAFGSNVMVDAGEGSVSADWGILGAGATLGTGASIVWGPSATAQRTFDIALGDGSEASGQNSIALGHLASATGQYSIAGGEAASATGVAAFAFGTNTVASTDRAVAVGDYVSATGAGSTVFGSGVSSGSPLVNADVDTVYIGSGQTYPFISASANVIALRSDEIQVIPIGGGASTLTVNTTTDVVTAGRSGTFQIDADGGATANGLNVTNPAGNLEIDLVTPTWGGAPSAVIYELPLPAVGLLHNSAGNIWTFSEVDISSDTNLTAGNGVAISGDTVSVNPDSSTIDFAPGGRTFKVATGGIGPTQIAATAVVAGSYVLSGLTVDADGRITAAASATLASGSVWIGNGSSVPTATSLASYDLTVDSVTANGAAGDAITGGRSGTFVVGVDGTIQVPTGTMALPGVRFGANNDGIMIANGETDVVVDGGKRMRIGSSSIDGGGNTREWQLTYGSGSISAPPFAIGGDANTGMSSSAADTLELGTGGAAGLQVSSAQMVNIRAGASTGTIAQLGGVLKMSTTQTGNGAGTQTDAWAYTVPANTLGSNGSSLSFYAAGTFSATANTDKRVSVVLGSDAAGQIFNSGDLTSIVSAAADWVVSGTCVRTGTSGAKCISSLSSNFSGFAGVMDYTTITTGLTAARTFAIEVDGTGASDTIFEMGKLSWAPVGGG